MFKINQKNIFKFLIIGLGVISVLLALVIAGSRVASQDKLVEITPIPSIVTNQAQEENFEIVYILNKGEGQETLKFDYILRKGERQTVFDVLKDLSASKGFELRYNYDFPQYGVFIDSIAGMDNEKTNGGKAWQYWINDNLGDLGVDKKELNGGDKVEWIYKNTPIY